MDLVWHTRDNLSSRRARKRESHGQCLALIVLSAKMLKVVRVHLLISSGTWLESLATRVLQVVHNRKLVEVKIRIDASQIR